MKILCLSDSHGREENIEKVFKKEDFQAVIHLGDSHDRTDVIDRLLQEYKRGCPIVFLKGNCDDFVPRGYKVVSYEGIPFYLTHGNMEHVNDGWNTLIYQAKNAGCKYALFGHTHRPDLIERDGITLANPGSISSPRQFPPNPSYLLIEISHGEVIFTHHFL